MTDAVTLKLYEKAIYSKVCSHCIDSGKSGKCNLPEDLRCGVKSYLPDIIRAVQSVNSEKMEDYLSVLRHEICSKCSQQDASGACKMRDVADCGLDRYFELVVEAIEEVDAGSGI